MTFRFIRLLLLLAALPAPALAQPTQHWPVHPITIVMGFPAGSGVDVVARLLQEPMEKSLGGRIVTDSTSRQTSRRSRRW